MKVLDIVRPKGQLWPYGLITEAQMLDNYTIPVKEFSIDWFGSPNGNKNAWWREEELEYIDNLPAVLAYNVGHPFGRGKIEGYDTYSDVRYKQRHLYPK